MSEMIRSSLARAISDASEAPIEQIINGIETPKNSAMGDLAFPTFELAKSRKINPKEFAEQLAAKLELPHGIAKVQAVGPFLNFFFDRKMIVESVLSDLTKAITAQVPAPSAKTTIVEYSSPNIAKPFHVGHLRATLVGGCLDKVYRFAGHRVASINHLGDWGTQFGFVWAGCKLWGRPAQPSVGALVDLYKRATSIKAKQETDPNDPEVATLPNVNEIARQYFIDLEAGVEDAVEFWKWCLEISLVYFRETYKRLNIEFDHYTGESFYSDMLDDVRRELEQKQLLISSQKALGVDLGEPLGFARVFTPDGRSLYMTRDLAAAEYRKREFDFEKAVYVVGAPQTLHFQQLKAILKRAGHDWSDDMIHVPFGTVLGMKTRGDGEIVELNDLLDEAYEEALKSYREQVSKRPDGLDEELVARGVALSALVFGTLSRNRMRDVQFSWEHALEFQGDTGPYLLYAYARINGIREKALAAGLTADTTLDVQKVVPHLTDESSYSLITALGRFNAMISETLAENEPAILAGYALDLAKIFSKAYLDLKVIGEEQSLAEARLSLFEITRRTLGVCIDLLGMSRLERM